MLWNFLKKNWLFPIRDSLQRKSPPARSHARLCLEHLESRTVPTTITATSASILYNDLPHNLTSAYASYQITNTDGVNHADVWATIGNFTAASGSPVVTLAPNAASAIDVGPLANGQTKTVFFYLGSNADTNVTQTHTVSVFNGPPASGSLLTSHDFSFTSVQSTIQANSNKVASVVVSPSTPAVGGTFTVTVTGSTGTIGSAQALDFTPAASSSWRADAFQLTGTTITFSGGNTGTFTDTLAIPPGSITSRADSNYSAVYTFQVVGPTATSTAVSPVAYISSGTQVKHTDTGNFATLPSIQPPMLPSPTLPSIQPPMLPSPTLNTTSTPATVTLGTNSVTLTDTASLADGVNPTGNITFTLVGPGGTTVDKETVAVNGNGTYTTPTGFILPSSGPVTGTYQWAATYSGDTNNNAANDQGGVAEQTVVSPASPTLIGATGADSVTLGTSPVTLTDSATLAGGVNPTGSITFTLVGPGGTTVDKETVAVNGNGTYATPTGFILPGSGAATGTYQWDVSYSGDSNNNATSDVNNASEQVPVSAASPAITPTPNSTSSNTNSTREQMPVNPASPVIPTTPNPTTVTQGATAVTQTDTASLAGGVNPTGSITFTLLHDGAGAPVGTQTVAVSGTGTHTIPTSFPLPTQGLAMEISQQYASYSGDNNTVTVTGNVTHITPPGFTLPSSDTATVTYQRYAGYLSGGSNNNAASTDNAASNANEQVPVMQEADLDLTKQVSSTEQMEGSDVTLTFIVHNSGPSTATNATVTDPFSGLTVVGPNTPSQGTFDPDTGVWSVGSLAPGASATLTVTARVEALGLIVSTAHARADQLDRNLANNSSAASLIGLSSTSGEADECDFASVNNRPAVLAPAPLGGQAREEEASDDRSEVEALDDLFALAGEDTSLLGGATRMLTLALLATTAVVIVSTGRRDRLQPGSTQNEEVALG
jgi:uncharacterized repeat protein (TIGR01451 family)